MQPLRLPGTMTTAGFLEQYWQKRALMMPAALPDTCSPFTPDELEALCGDPDIESRLAWIDEGRWHLRSGPLGADDFAPLGDLPWTILLQDIEKHFPELQGFLKSFDFLPRWRIEDLMISYATPGGGVGPHLDNYDVFLVQLSGRRRWRVDTRREPPELADHEGLRHVRNFRATGEWHAARGDVLYLPPGLPHWGTAMADESPCITLSVGLRAPGADEMLHAAAEVIASRSGSMPRYTDPDLRVDESAPGLISQASVVRARALLEQCSQLSDPDIAICFGRLVTETKPWLTPEPRQQVVSASELRARADAGMGVKRHPFSVMAWYPSDETLDFFVDGDHMKLPDHLRQLLLSFCADDGRLTGGQLRPWLEDALATEFFLHFLSLGKLIFEDE